MLDGDRLAAWITYLASPSAAADAMRPLELDGYLCGIIVSPDLILPGEWLDCIWGEDGPQLGDLAQAQKIFESVTGHYNALIERMDDEKTPFAPMFVGSDGVAKPRLFEPWLLGFLKAMSLQVEEWEERASVDPEFELLTSPIMIAAEHQLGGDKGKAGAPLPEAFALIPQVLPLLRLHVQSPAPPRPRGRARGPGARKGKSQKGNGRKR